MVATMPTAIMAKKHQRICVIPKLAEWSAKGSRTPASIYVYTLVLLLTPTASTHSRQLMFTDVR